MATSSLYPPNSSSLSDVVIGDVMQRSVSPYSRSSVVKHWGSNYPTKPQSLELIAGVVTGDELRVHAGHKRRAYEAMADERPKFEQTEDDSSVNRQALTTPAPKTRKERCRINQARYRNRQRKYAVGLQESIQQLKEEIYKREVDKMTIIRCAPTNETVWNVAAEYFRLFRHGYMVPLMDPASDVKSACHSHVQLEFMQKTMATDVTDGDLCGAEAILENWRLLSLYHKDLQVKLKRLEKGPGESLVAKTSTSLTITENTLQYVYPHLVEREEWTAVGLKMLNKRFVVRGSVRIDWDNNNGRVVRMESTADLLSPMLGVLGNLRAVARVFSGAALSPELKFVV